MTYANARPEGTSYSLLQQREKIVEIMDVIELMEETNKGKQWMLEQIRVNHLKIPINPSMGIPRILKLCPSNFVSNLLNKLFSDIGMSEGPPPLTTTYHWFFTDIVSSTDPGLTTSEQARKIIILNNLIERTEVFRHRDPKLSLILPTGDGMAIGFSDSPEKPLLLALELHKDLNNYNNQKKDREGLYLRIGLDTGPVYIIKDLSGKENVWGPGIIMARRVMDLALGMNIIASSRIANDIRTLRPEYKNIMHPIGDYSIKHGVKILIYNVYGEGFGNKKSPTTEKVQKSAESEEALKTVNRFLYNEVQIELHVTDISSMMTHHHMNWNLYNISSHPVERIFYYLEGGVSKDFPEMNVVVKDEENQELDMVSLNVNKPYHKEFYMKLKRPLKPGQRGRWVKLEYDWEEPDRRYLYSLSSDCKKLSFALFVPRQLQISQKVVNVSIETGEKRYASVPASVKYLANETQVMWEAKNLRSHDAYRFDW